VTVDSERFIMEILKAIRSELGDVRRDVTDLKVRQNASEHFEQGMMAHVASIHGAVDALRVDVDRIKSRLELVS
jgi:hypothetical protein